MTSVESEPAATSRLLRTLETVDVPFAATADARTGAFVLDRFERARTDELRNLAIPLTTGLGGRCIALRRAVAVKAYAAARRPVLFAERLLYQATGMVAGSVDGARVTERVVAERLGRRMRDIRSELRGIADVLTDSDVRARLLDVLDRIPVPPVQAGLVSVKLTRRELEVLSEVATGRGNRQGGPQLRLTEQTVKSYLRSAMTKLNSSTPERRYTGLAMPDSCPERSVPLR